MDKKKNNCEDINKASKQVTNLVLLPYKTPILQGIIKIINEFKKNDDDGIDYKKLCEQTSRYVNAQKNCVKDVTTSKGRTFVPKEWKDIISGLVQTYEKYDVKRLCYYEGDKETTKKKHVLNIHNVFRKFCIEKKSRFQNLGDMDFLQCSNYMSWITEKKKGLQALDPNYENIREYQEYFNIHHNCNYLWLLRDTPDIICSVRTKTKTKEQHSKVKTSVDSSQSLPDGSKDSPAGSTKANPPTQQPSPKVEGDPRSEKPPNTGLEKARTQGTPSGDDNVDHVPQFYDVNLQGTPVDEPSPVPKSPDKQTFPEYSDPKVQEFIEKHIQDNFHGQIITHDTRHAINRNPDTIYKYNPSYIDGEAITPPITEPNNYIPLEVRYSQRFIQLLHSQRFIELLRLQPFRNILFSKRFLSNVLSKERFIPQIIHSQQVPPAIPHREFYVPKPKPIKTQVALIPAEPIFHPRITTEKDTDNKIKDIVKVEKGPAIPDPSHFRFPFMIYTLVFLTISTAITILYLLSKYTSFGLLFNKKKKKKRLKRNLEIKKISEESPHFDNIDNHSINDIPYEYKIHDNKNIYNQIIIQKGVLKKNISIPQGKKNKRKAIIDIHMELLNEYKNDEWEMNKNDFLQICLEEFIREQNKIYSNSENTNLVMKYISIQNTKEDKMLLLDEWTERCRPIWEKFKSENAFKVLQYEWMKEEKEYLENIEQFENNILNENTKISCKEIKKGIWRKWITKQAKFIEQFTQEKWFKSLVKQIEDISDEYKMEEIKDDIFVLNIEKLDNVNNNEELYKHYNNLFLIRVLIQIFMMVIEESIKEESPEKTELVLDNIIEISKDHLEYNEMLEKVAHKYKDSFKELMEGCTNKPDKDINSADDKNKSDKWVEMTDKNFLNPSDDTSENPIHYIRE
ncbi:STP1 protein [Plasmodium ovale curtisi]|uniref:STP1 protein n=1 Tax=Plasmodium ovale curtisi TaxID=864141 RepID=A0A1A8WN57_PLAOA|nr:STP1 protein [Plasmodium ovale curtisi]